MKILEVVLFLLWTSACFGQTNSSKLIDKSALTKSVFKIYFTTFNSAERIFNGTTTYFLTDSIIKVTKTFFDDTTRKTVYLSPIKNRHVLISSINKIALDSLQDYYFNTCVMITSGEHYIFDFEKSSTKKTISLHHYYLKQLDEIIQIINSNLPKKYHYRYLPQDTKHDCAL